MTASPATPDDALSFGRRADHLARLAREELDLLVVGGGITGAGIALDAAARGLRVGLLERADFAAGTSSRSTKLVHGGLRYLAQLEIALTREALRERYVLQDLAPGLVEWLPFVLPVYAGGLELAKLAAGLWLYDFLAGRRAPTPHRQLSRAELLALAPGLAQPGLVGGFVYSDCRTDDVRLTLEVLRTAVGRGAAIANYAEVTGFLRQPASGPAPESPLRPVAEWVVGVEAVDRRAGRPFAVRARKVVLAAGVWLDRLLRLVDPAAPARVRPARGVHLVVNRARLGFDVALFLPTAPDGRLVFVIPWQGATLIGTTDTDHAGSLEAPLATPDDLSYLLASVNRAFPDARLTPADVVSVQAGLRPLVSAGDGSTARLSREDHVLETPEGLIAIAGGKLTTYRRMAERVVDLAVWRLRESGQIVADVGCQTDRIALGAFAPRPRPPALPGLAAETAAHLRRSYGANAAVVAAIAAERPELREPLVAGLPHLRAEVVYAARHELAETVGDALVRRSHVVQLDPGQGRSAAPVAARLLAAELGWDVAQATAELARFEEEVWQYTPATVLA